jgi:hypothetical protein
MRPLRLALGLGLALTLTGCVPSWSFLSDSNRNQGVPDRPVSAAELVAELNASSQQIQSLVCQDVDIDYSQSWGGSFGGIRGRLACEQPHGFRMSASVMSRNELDLGSNDQEFWYWIGKSPQPFQFYCSYADLRSQQIPLNFPFQPEWIMETLGMASYPPDARYQVVDRRKTIELIQETTSLQGQPVRKVVVFNRQPRKNEPRISAYILRDLRGNELCSARIQSTQLVGQSTVPYQMQLSWPDQKMKLGLQLNKPSVNQLPEEAAQRLFQRPQLQNIPSYNLADLSRSGRSPGSIQRVGGTVH